MLEGFDIPDISTSMTINGPAPAILAMYFVAAQELRAWSGRSGNGGSLSPEGAGGYVCEQTLEQLRGTVQADILKEVQAQNESIFQTDFAIRLLGDVQEWFIANGVRKFYSLSISGYHIGEAGASPVQETGIHPGQRLHLYRKFPGRGAWR